MTAVHVTVPLRDGAGDDLAVSTEWATGDMVPHPHGEGYVVDRFRLRVRGAPVTIDFYGTAPELRSLLNRMLNEIGGTPDG
jgi:hypothetical protein